MAIEKQYEQDAQVILSHRRDYGADYWTTPDKRLLKGAPFSAFESALFLLELGMEPDEPVLKETAALFFDAWREDGSFKLNSGFPCETVHAMQLLCRMGYAHDERLQKTFRHLLDTRYDDGGWRCNKFFFGHGPETECANPMPTLIALDIFRFYRDKAGEEELDDAVEFLLAHWEIKKPIGPCHYGIGTLFMQVEYPFRNYNLFYYLYILSFYRKARTDARFLAALRAFEAKLQNGQVVVERVVPKLARLHFCQKGKPSGLATRHYDEIRQNLARDSA